MEERERGRKEELKSVLPTVKGHKQDKKSVGCVGWVSKRRRREE